MRFVKSYPMQGSAPPGTWNLEPGPRTALRSLVAPLMFIYVRDAVDRSARTPPTPKTYVRTVHRARSTAGKVLCRL